MSDSSEIQLSESDVVWTPPQELIAHCALTKFLNHARKRSRLALFGFEDLHRWAVRDPKRFWPELLQFLDLHTEGDPFPLWGNEAGPTPLARRWFPNLSLSYTENLLRGDSRETVIVSWSEDRLRRSLTRGELCREVSLVASFLAKSGVGSGDRVFAYLPNIPEAVSLMLGSAAAGATWSSCGTDYEVDGVLARAERVQPRVFVAASAYLWRGKVVDLTATVSDVVRRIPSIELVLLVDYLHGEDPHLSLSSPKGVAVASLAEIRKRPEGSFHFKRRSFSHPLYIMFSSGTTGKPKGIVHGAGGTLLEHMKEHQLHADIRCGERLFYQTSTSWMMWNWLVSGLASGACIVLYDGDPMMEKGEILWRMADTERVAHFGTSAAFLGAIEKQGVKPNAKFSLDSLRAILSTGSTLYPTQFDYIARAIKPVWIESISGGTDILGCFGLGCPLKPVVRGAAQAKSLGYDVCVYNDRGERVVGQEGELICAKPAPSMPIYFLEDPSGESYRAAYFNEFPSVWRHGDFLREGESGELYFQGRSDATLKPGGVRVATADIYAILQPIPGIQQALAVGYVPHGGTSEKIVLFVVLNDGVTFDEALRDDIKARLRKANAFYVPSLILQAPALPRTANNKLSELSVKRILKGGDLGNTAALANPESLRFFIEEATLKVRAALG